MHITNTRKWGTLAIACLAALLLSVDLTVLHLAIPRLTEDLDPSATQVLWIADVYGFVLAGLLVTMGNIGDRIGRKKLLLLGSAAFGIASAISAYATGPELLIAARALLGVAGATIMPSTLSLIRSAFTDAAQRTTAIGIWSGMAAGGVALGPVVGGLVLDHFWWGAVFLINVPIMALILLAGFVVLPESRNPAPGRIDVPSVLLSIAGIMSVVYVLQESTRGDLTRPAVLSAAAIGVVGLTLFAWRQTRLAEPLIDVKLFGNRGFSGAVGANVVSMFALAGMSLLFAQYFQLVLGWSPLKAGLAMMPASLAAMTGAMLCPPLIARLGRAKVAAGGLLVAAAGNVLYTGIGVQSNYPYFLFAGVVAATGIGFIITVTGDTILATVPAARAGAGSAISETATELGSALGMAVLGSVLNGAYRGGIRLPAGLPDPVAHGARDSLGGALYGLADLPARTARTVAEAARQAFVDGMHAAELTGACLIAGMAVLTLFALRGLPKVITKETTGNPPAQAPTEASRTS